VYKPIRGAIMADALVENVFANVVHNAIVHSKCKTIEIFGMAETINGVPYHKVVIADDGVGIPSDIVDKVFEPRVKGSDSLGSGLGLYLVKKLVESYGGFIKVLRNKNKKNGTRFNIYFPKTQ
jgi:signal transduction histidine kinase